MTNRIRREGTRNLVAAAKQTDWRAELIALLGGEAGLRSGEMVALEWSDVDGHGSAIGTAAASLEGVMLGLLGGL